MKISFVYMAWGVGVIAVLFWTGLAYIVWEIRAEALRLEFARTEAESFDVSETTATKNRIAIRESAAMRSEVYAYVDQDILKSIEEVEAVGIQAGVPLRITAAVPDGGVPEPLEGVNLATQSRGNFSSLVRVAHSLSYLSAPVFVERIEFVRDIDAPSATPWTLEARLKAYSLKQSL